MPVAVYLYSRGWTRLLAFDLDTKTHGAAAVLRDAAWLRKLVESAGGVVVEDRNPASGGRHLYVPLAEPVKVEHVRPLLEVLGRFCRTLDPTPMLNPATGCIVPPGSWTKEHARRELIGSLPEAAGLLDRGSERGLIARMLAELGTTNLTPLPVPTTPGVDRADFLDGRLPADLCLHSPLPEHITAFAIDGTMQSRWPSRSEARAAVLAACALRGWTLPDVRTQLDSKWIGLAEAYRRYGRAADNQLQRDWTTAFDWALSNAPKFRSPGHKTKHTGGQLGSEVHKRWLANAHRWVRAEFATARHKHVVLAVLQALAASAATAGELINDVPVVAVGRRSLAIAAGLIPDTTVGDVLAELRDLPGSPILRVRQASGVLADRYALVTSSVTEDDPVRRDRVRVEPVHPVWRIVGLHLRQVYELVVDARLSMPADVFAAAGIGASAGSSALAELASYGLIERPHGRCEPGSVTLDDVAAAHGLDGIRSETIDRYRRERDEWHEWLELRGHIQPADAALFDVTPAGIPTPPPGWEIDDSEALWAARMADGPPADRPDHVSVIEQAVSLIMEELGGTLLVPEVIAASS